jgi:pSer/pThr/pTyr-binding forkhead associated (FHA) protein
MPKLILQFEDRVLSESVIGPQGVKIGRLPNNQVVIDNPAVSGHHARVIRDGDKCILEDLQSTNGTFVNEKAVTRHELRSGDVILIGKHTILFDGRASEEPVEDTDADSVPELGGTMVLDTAQQRLLLAKIEEEAQAKRAAAAAAAAAVPAAGTGTERQVVKPGAEPPAPPPAPRVGRLRVLSGRTDQAEYDLEAHTSIVGKTDTALVRLKGWFKPKVALAIARKGESYSATPMGGNTTVNGETLSARRELKAGDIIKVSGVMLQFDLAAANQRAKT